MSQVEYLAEVTVYDPALPGEVTHRFARFGLVTRPSETPPNVAYDPRLAEPGDVSRAIASGGALFGRARRTVGDVVLSNADGALDALAACSFAGRSLTIRRGPVGGAYPSAYPVLWTGTADDCEITTAAMRVRVRDATLALDAPLQANVYAGDNVLPDGLEGVEGDLKGRPKPLVFGTVKNIPLPCVNTAKLIYQLSDGPIASVAGVYDKGVPLGWPTNWSSQGAINSQGRAAFDGTTFYHVNVDGEIYTSTTGLSGSWTMQDDLAVGLVTVHAIAGMAVAVGNSGGVFTSTDSGATWVDRSLGIGQTLRAVWYSSRLALWIVAGDNGVLYTATDPNGTWTVRTSSFSTTSIRGFAESETALVACGASGKIATSTNGTSWTQRESSVGANYSHTLNAAAYAEGLFRIVGDSGVIIRSDASGAVWEYEPNPFDGANGGTAYALQAIAYGNGAWMVGGGNTSGYGLAIGPDRVWQRVPASGQAAFSIVYTGLFWFATSGTRSGVSIAGEEMASIPDLEDDANTPTFGDFTWVSHVDGSYVRLGSPPAGLVTADASHGATSADRTPGQLFATVLQRAGYTSGDWSASDVTALDSADNAECGVYVADGERVADAIEAIAGTVGAWWGAGTDGVFRIAQMTLPSGSPVLTLTANDTTRLERRPSPRPTYATSIRWGRNYVVQASDLADGVPDARRAVLAAEWREAVETDTAVQTEHLLATRQTYDSLYATAAAALAEAQRRQAITGAKRDFFDWEGALNAETEALELGDTITIEFPRFGLDAGRDLRIIGVATERGRNRLRLSLFG